MARRRKESPFDALTVSEPISATLRDGTTVIGTLWLHPSQRGRFEVAYDGMRKSDGRTDYTDIGHIRGIGKAILREMAEDNKCRS